jgi:hypothetical protein
MASRQLSKNNKYKYIVPKTSQYTTFNRPNMQLNIAPQVNPLVIASPSVTQLTARPDTMQLTKSNTLTANSTLLINPPDKEGPPVTQLTGTLFQESSNQVLASPTFQYSVNDNFNSFQYDMSYNYQPGFDQASVEDVSVSIYYIIYNKYIIL